MGSAMKLTVYYVQAATMMFHLCHGRLRPAQRVIDTELPATVLDELATRYPVEVSGQFRPEYNELYITVAIQAEIFRRSRGQHPGEARSQVAQTRA